MQCAQPRCTANAECLGATLSRNVGNEQGGGEYILFIDDDVSPEPGLLGAYVRTIRDHPDAPGYVGPTLFPRPVNAFTRGVRASGMLTFFDMPADDRWMPWGTTSNLPMKRSTTFGSRRCFRGMEGARTSTFACASWRGRRRVAQDGAVRGRAARLVGRRAAQLHALCAVGVGRLAHAVDAPGLAVLLPSEPVRDDARGRGRGGGARRRPARPVARRRLALAARRTHGDRPLPCSPRAAT